MSGTASFWQAFQWLLTALDSLSVPYRSFRAVCRASAGACCITPPPPSRVAQTWMLLSKFMARGRIRTEHARSAYYHGYIAGGHFCFCRSFLHPPHAMPPATRKWLFRRPNNNALRSPVRYTPRADRPCPPGNEVHLTWLGPGQHQMTQPRNGQMSPPAFDRAHAANLHWTASRRLAKQGMMCGS